MTYEQCDTSVTDCTIVSSLNPYQCPTSTTYIDKEVIVVVIESIGSINSVHGSTASSAGRPQSITLGFHPPIDMGARS